MISAMVVASLTVCLTSGAVLDIARDCGAVPNAAASNVSNAAAFTKCLAKAAPGDTVLVPSGAMFYMVGGIAIANKVNLTIQIQGDIFAVPDFEFWPRDSGESYLDFFTVSSSQHVTIAGTGSVYGGGLDWWNKVVFPGIFGPLKGGRPKLFVVSVCSDVIIKNITLLDSPSWHILLNDVLRAEVGFVTISVNRTRQHELKAVLRARRAAAAGAAATTTGSWPPAAGLQPEDLNTDGIDPSGTDVWIHDCAILNDDDSIAVKPCDGGCQSGNCSQNMLIENLVLTGFGASIGSVPPHTNVNCVRNITFRNINMPETGKGVYIKSNPDCRNGGTALITDVSYINITMTKPRWWAIWIGPQQQQEPHESLGETCSLFYPIQDKCPTQGCATFSNILLQNVSIIDPWLSPGVILGNASNPMQNITFDNVNVVNPPQYPFNGTYLCQFATIRSVGSATFPVPDCL